MNKNVLESQWVQVRELLREKFSYLTEDDIRQINGRYDELVAKLQQKYGYTKEEAEERIRNWNFDRFSAPRGQVVREDTMIKEKEPIRNDSSIYKWLLGLGIPLLLLASYFLTMRTPEVTRSPVVTQEQVALETPTDQLLSNDLRNVLLSQQNLAGAMQNVQITTNNGIVTLSGTVPNRDARNLIINTTQNFAGVRQVVDHLEIR